MLGYVVGLVVVVVIVFLLWPREKKVETTVGAPAGDAAKIAGLAPPASESSGWSRDEAADYVWGQLPSGAKAAAVQVKDNATGFASTLMRRAGVGSAGVDNFGSNHTFGTFDSYKQNFKSGADVAKNTMWSGYQRPAALKL